ncbi:MAG: type II toxin-antitoxin system HicB family antitoxin [Lachnospirales bacterium]
MLSVYPACFFKEENGYSIIFPDLNWLSTCGSNLQEAMEMAVDCLAGYLYTCKKDNEDIPEPSDINNIDIKAIEKELEISSDNAFVNMIAVDVAEYAKSHFEKSVKKTLTIPMWLNNAAIEQGINFSQTLQNALKEQLNIK